MGYQSPYFMQLHAGAVAGASAITTKYVTATGYGKERLIDFRQSLLCRFNASQADHHIEIDRGTGTLPSVNHLVIPVGHNFAGSPNLLIYSGAASPAATLRGTYPTPGAGWPIDFPFTGTTDRYLRLLFQGSGQWELPELWIGARLTMTRGPDPGWEEPYVVPVSVVEFPTREITSQLGPARQSFGMIFRDVPDLSADETMFREIAAIGRSTPILFWPPTNAAVPTFVRLLEDVEIAQDSPAPMVRLGRSFRIRLLEQTS